MTTATEAYHDDSFCGACNGPLECSRDAICKTCYPDEQWDAELAALDELFDLVREG